MTPDTILSAVAEIHGITVDDLKSARYSGGLYEARTAAVLGLRLAGLSRREIGAALGGRDKTWPPKVMRIFAGDASALALALTLWEPGQRPKTTAESRLDRITAEMSGPPCRCGLRGPHECLNAERFARAAGHGRTYPSSVDMGISAAILGRLGRRRRDRERTKEAA